MTDEELLTKYLETKDHELYAILDERMRERLYALSFRIMQSVEDAEDIVQDAFFKLLLLKPQSEPIRSAESFLFRMVQNLCYDQKRNEETDVLAHAESLDVFDDPDCIDDDADYSACIPRKRELADKGSVLTESQQRGLDRQKEALVAMESLPTTQREAVEQYHCRGMTAARTAEILHTNEKTVEKRVELGIKKLRKTMGVQVEEVPHIRALQASNVNGEIVHHFPRVTDAARAGFSTDCLYRALKRGTPYRDLTWSYANAT